MLRRTFLQSLPAALGAAAPAAIAETADATAATDAPAKPVRLGFDTYSVRAFRWKAPQLLDYAASLKLDTIQISSMGDYESLEPAYLQKIKDQADRHNIKIDSGMGWICPSAREFKKNGPPAREQMLTGLRTAKAVGATAMRCILGTSADRRGPIPIEEHMENTVKVFKSVRSEALDLGVKIALENHSGDLQAREVKTIIEEAGPDYVAACLDTGNPIECVEDPFVTLEILAPYVVTTHIRDTSIFEQPRGAAFQWVALGDGDVDFARFIREFRRLCPNSSVQLEIITGRAPKLIPYMDQDFWKAFPKMPASEFTRFLALVKSGHPFMGQMVIEDGGGRKPPAIMEALKEQQRIDLERSLEYAKKKLDVGINWRA